MIYGNIEESWYGCPLNLHVAIQLIMSFQSQLGAKLHNVDRRAEPVTLDTPDLKSCSHFLTGCGSSDITAAVPDFPAPFSLGRATPKHRRASVQASSSVFPCQGV